MKFLNRIIKTISIIVPTLKVKYLEGDMAVRILEELESLAVYLPLFD